MFYFQLNSLKVSNVLEFSMSKRWNSYRFCDIKLEIQWWHYTTNLLNLPFLYWMRNYFPRGMFSPHIYLKSLNFSLALAFSRLNGDLHHVLFLGDSLWFFGCCRFSSAPKLFTTFCLNLLWITFFCIDHRYIGPSIASIHSLLFWIGPFLPLHKKWITRNWTSWYVGREK